MENENIDKMKAIAKDLKKDFDAFDFSLEKVPSNDMLLTSLEEDPPPAKFSIITMPQLSSTSGIVSVSLRTSRLGCSMGFGKSFRLGDSTSVRIEGEPYKDTTAIETREAYDKTTQVSKTSGDSMGFTIGNSESKTINNTAHSKSDGNSFSYREGDNTTSTSYTGASSSANVSLQNSSYQIYDHRLISTVKGFSMGLHLGLTQYKIRRQRMEMYTVNVNFNDYLVSSRIVNVFISVWKDECIGASVENIIYKGAYYGNFLGKYVYGKDNCQYEDAETYSHVVNGRLTIHKNYKVHKRGHVLGFNRMTILGK